MVHGAETSYDLYCRNILLAKMISGLIIHRQNSITEKSDDELSCLQNVLPLECPVAENGLTELS